ncbi:YlbD family protein [Cytobacillus gottheilii]|uniref:YlbD family protein n=1 Tax=Cytobacillus gottheilii TaxID=859144 RepID=UPI0009B9EB59|nr:YlbD family protein [Cytobacillus gottheilii]
MAEKKLHPSVEKFKEFVKGHPELVKEVRSGKHTWQELYEDWYLLGEEDTRWNTSNDSDEQKETDEDKKSDFMATLLGSLKKMDPNQMQGYVQNISQALAAIQGVIGNFQGGGTDSKSPGTNHNPPPNPFGFRKD